METITTIMLVIAVILLMVGMGKMIKTITDSIAEVPGDFDEARAFVESMTDEEFEKHMVTIPGFLLISHGWEPKKHKLANNIVSYYSDEYENYTIRVIDEEKIRVQYLGQEIAVLQGEPIGELEGLALTYIAEQDEAKYE